MSVDFRETVEKLIEAGELLRITRPVDIRYIGTLVEDSDKALLFENVAGYDMPVVSGVLNSPERIGIAMDCEFSQSYKKLDAGIANPIPSVMVESAVSREVTYQVGDDVDLLSLPIPLFADLDGGPMITAGLIIANDEESGLNAGFYRLLVREKNLTSIDVVSPNDLRRIVEHNTAQNKPTPISVNIGTNAALTFGCGYKAPADTNEIEISGGIMGEPVKLAACESIDVPCIADAEMVMEAEILPTGWTKPEGRFGEFHQSMGALHWNPQVRIKAIYTRKNPVYWALHMPWEVIWLAGPVTEGPLRNTLREAGVQVTGVRFPPGGSCYFHAVISIKAKAGDARVAIMAALTTEIKHVTIVDDDIDVTNPDQVEWAVATRVQADKDVIIVPGLRAKPLDPSLELTTGRTPTTAKMGIDATISKGLPSVRFVPVSFVHNEDIDAEEYLSDANGAVDEPVAVDIAELADEIRDELKNGEPMYHSEINKQKWSQGFEAVNRALAQLHEKGDLWQDDIGRLCLRDSPFAAKPPSEKMTH